MGYGPDPERSGRWVGWPEGSGDSGPVGGFARRGARRHTMAMITDSTLARGTEAEGLSFAREVLRIEADALDRVRKRLDVTIARAAERVFQCRGSVIVTGMGKAGIV